VADLTAVDDGTFGPAVLASAVPVVVDFWAPYCRPCDLLAPVLEELQREYGGAVQFVTLNADENTDTAGAYAVFAMPTLVVFQAGKEVHRQVGFKAKAQLKPQLDRALALAAAR